MILRYLLQNLRAILITKYKTFHASRLRYLRRSGLVMYPHKNIVATTAAVAKIILQVLLRPNLFISKHMVHRKSRRLRPQRIRLGQGRSVGLFLDDMLMTMWGKALCETILRATAMDANILGRIKCQGWEVALQKLETLFFYGPQRELSEASTSSRSCDSINEEPEGIEGQN